MSYRNILVHIDSSPHASARLRYALQVAEAHDAHLTGLFVAPSPFMAVTGSDPAAAGAYYDLHAEVLADAERARATFNELTALRHDRSEWRQAIGLPVDTICVNARYHDLVIISQYEPGVPVDNLSADFPQAVALGCGRPVLMLPFAGAFKALARHALIGWNDSREGARAVSDALPLLKQAAQVTVLTINPKVAEQAHGEIPGADIAHYLARHGLTVNVIRESAFSRDAGEVLLTVAADRQADLLVMGFYGHSRLRELVMGGASRTILDAMTVPVLLSH